MTSGLRVPWVGRGQSRDEMEGLQGWANITGGP